MLDLEISIRAVINGLSGSIRSPLWRSVEFVDRSCECANPLLLLLLLLSRLYREGILVFATFSDGKL